MEAFFIILCAIIIFIWVASIESKNKKRTEDAINQRKRAAELLIIENQNKQKALNFDLGLQQNRIKEPQYYSMRNNSASFINLAKLNNVNCLYHFTDRSNIQSIIQNGGLLSWKNCENKFIAIPKSGGSTSSKNLDSRAGLENYVRLSFVRSHPMMHVARKEGRITNPVILEIDISVLGLNGNKFSTMNAVHRGAVIGSDLNCLTEIKFSLFPLNYFNLESDGRAYYQAEVLVLEKLPLEYITNIKKFI